MAKEPRITKAWVPGQGWVEYEVVWCGEDGELLPGYASTSPTAHYCQAIKLLLRPERKEQLAAKDTYRIVGRKRRPRKDDK